jgi:HAD superfamily hydrolase (TIGR01549 family)
MAIQGVIFDLGHTLIYLDSTWPEVFERGVADLAGFLNAQGLGLDGQAFARTLLERREEGFVRAGQTHREVTAKDSMRWVFARFGLCDPDPALVAGAIDAFFAYEQAHWLPYPEAQAVLQDLSDRGLRLGMFSNATHDPLIQHLVDHLGFRHWLDPALSSAGTGIRKPDPAAFAPILGAWKLPPDSVVMVGDTLDADVLGARQAGMRSIWLPSREDARQEGPRGSAVPDATVRRLSDLPACLEQLQVCTLK